ncbi:MAG TPA: hypothetical protein VKA21_11870 [Candidatus Binatia bacterium]|nr:hypothetical protein [Candidatus Binatia bacterium]
MKTHTSLAAALFIAGALGALLPATADAGCGCSKPPPPRAAVRPFVGYADQSIVIFNDALAPGTAYWVQFTSSTDGSVDWSRGKVSNRRDFADGQARSQLRVAVPNVAMGPCTISVWAGREAPLFTLSDDQFTVIAAPIVLHDFNETVTQDDFQTGVGRDGTVYIAVDVTGVSDATTFTGTANGFPLMYGSQTIAMYNQQGFLMQVLDPTSPGLFRIVRGGNGASDTLEYWRHEFRTYKQEHRQLDARRNDDDPDWHADGSPHIDHNKIVVAVSGTLPNGGRPAPGATPAFELVVQSQPAAESPLR